MRWIPLAVAALLAASPAAAFFGPPAEIAAAKEALELHYINRKIYSPVSCRYEKVQAAYYILCGPVPRDRQTPGGLFLVTGERGQSTVAPVNGKAKGHIGSAGVISAADGKAVPVIQAPAGIDVTGILEKFF
ncbi:MAG TPA: hypothetical protein VEB64_09410 [Azospirillaceae bacterium]|nr:hypothetical protein [Azospirillaceae bacterium]